MHWSTSDRCCRYNCRVEWPWLCTNCGCKLKPNLTWQNWKVIRVEVMCSYAWHQINAAFPRYQLMTCNYNHGELPLKNSHAGNGPILLWHIISFNQQHLGGHPSARCNGLLVAFSGIISTTWAIQPLYSLPSWVGSQPMYKCIAQVHGLIVKQLGSSH